MSVHIQGIKKKSYNIVLRAKHQYLITYKAFGAQLKGFTSSHEFHRNLNMIFFPKKSMT